MVLSFLSLSIYFRVFVFFYGGGGGQKKPTLRGGLEKKRGVEKFLDFRGGVGEKEGGAFFFFFFWGGGLRPQCPLCTLFECKLIPLYCFRLWNIWLNLLFDLVLYQRGMLSEIKSSLIHFLLISIINFL